MEGRRRVPCINIICRGIERRNIFKDNTDRNRFLGRLGSVLQKTSTPCYGWALMPIMPPFCFATAHELKILLSDSARKLGMTAAGVGCAVRKGEAISIGGNYQLID